MSAVLFIFIDGVGLGRPDPAVNPLAGLPLLGNFVPDAWTPLPDGGRPETLPAPERPGPVPWGGRLRSTDPSLGVAGLPQSATGQTTLFTGINAAELLGHHLYGFPGPRLRGALMSHSILKQVVEMGRPAAFLNAYRPLFFEMGEAIWKRPMSASSWNNRAAGLPFRSFDDLRAGRAVYYDFTHREAIARGADLPFRTPEEAGAILARSAEPFDLAIYEFFLTDRVGHTGDLDRARVVAAELERFLSTAIQATDLTRRHVVITSDHGNVEDMTTKSHTHHPVPTLVWGPDADRLLDRLGRLEDFAGALVGEIGRTGA